MAVSKRKELNVFGKQSVFISDPDVRKIEYEICQPSIEYNLFSIKPASGPVPEELEGKFTTIAKAEQVVRLFLRNAVASKNIVKPKDTVQ